MKFWPFSTISRLKAESARLKAENVRLKADLKKSETLRVSAQDGYVDGMADFARFTAASQMLTVALDLFIPEQRAAWEDILRERGWSGEPGKLKIGSKEERRLAALVHRPFA